MQCALIDTWFSLHKAFLKNSYSKIKINATLCRENVIRPMGVPTSKIDYFFSTTPKRNMKSTETSDDVGGQRSNKYVYLLQ